MNILEKINNYLSTKGLEVIWLDSSGKQTKKVYKEKDWKKEISQAEDYPSFSELINMARKGKIYAAYYDFHDEENITANNSLKVIKGVVAKEKKKSEAFGKSDTGGRGRNDLDYDY